MLSEIDKRVIAGFAAAFLLLVVTMFFSYRNMSQFRSISFEVAHTNQVLFQIEQVFADMIEIESNQRGLLIYKDQAFEDNYLAGTKSIETHLDTLLKLTSHNPEQFSRADTLKRLISQKITFANILLGDSSRRKAVLATAGISLRGKRLTDAIKRVSEEMKVEERRLLDEQVAQANAANSQFYRLYIAFGFVIIIIFITVLYIIRTRMQERIEAEKVLKLRSAEIQDLYYNAPCGYHSLGADGKFIEVNNTFAAWLGYTREEMLNKMGFIDILPESEREIYLENFPKFVASGRVDNLEVQLVRRNGSSFYVILSAVAIFDEQGRYLKDRATTFDISARKEAEEKARLLNNELEAFSYSVSHDLRAPLRSIDSYTKILQEEYAEKLDEEGKRLMGVVISNAARMGQLIDDLLEFSRLGRKELIKSEFNMERLVRTVCDEMELDMKGRNLALDLRIDVMGWADKSMLRQVWSNLIGNALKYSAREAEQRIEIGYEVEASSIVFYIKDNGVGFDMKYYDRLFAVFQRLHTSKEFAGTGVGLALTHRIVSKHGGKIWAESEPGKGATFFFSLPTNNHQYT